SADPSATLVIRRNIEKTVNVVQIPLDGPNGLHCASEASGLALKLGRASLIAHGIAERQWTTSTITDRRGSAIR
ncbi:UNVERIFIED_CONTAM: hypothetical protein NY603_37540, partial [Bacteroidetes bacterium 56_B9]